ncbi:heterokaryon incompatibility protein-domain-containing protein [Podospora didyma]|uniref:Heterokaryon incompatibility protein-domain-containing protein n=1 Tax=Podospora didyma TaxID=330526 RepID=A0AAE0K6M2_9PEZI|nr:heterokaryon incompatibility protein-domain-containing protein [Podospora didyma]
MRLINTQTLRMREFLSDVPPYAILSHTWGDNEVTFASSLTLLKTDISTHQPPLSQQSSSHPGEHEGPKVISKIAGFCDLAKGDGYEWGWVDTCCIDKSSSAELSEAINSMYRWYADAAVCYVYLSDVDSSRSVTETRPNYDVLVKDIQQSRWFIRGWTLQELLAPYVVEFYDAKWRIVGTKKELCSAITAKTGIPEEVLLGGNACIRRRPGAERLSWASDRTTTRPEDLAYCLLGIMDVNMPMVYGEGGKKAFARLLDKYIRLNNDHSLLLWVDAHPFAAYKYRGGGRAALATQPSEFKRSQPLRTWTHFPERQIGQQ